MADFRVSLPELLIWCRRAEATAISQRLLFFESEEKGWIHYVPRLLVLLEGKSELRSGERCGKPGDPVVEAPAFLYCSRTGGLFTGRVGNSPSKTLSFSYYPTCIRAMLIDFDGVNTPPTARDIFYHSAAPLAEAGMKLLELLDLLHDAGDDGAVRELLPLLFKLTLRDLEASSAAPVLMVRKLWDDINTYLREHRSEPVTRAQIAGLFRISPGYVSELCRKYADDSFSHLQLRCRLEHAEHLLRNSRLSVNEIAEDSGFSCANYFIRRFKAAYGTTPHVYRNLPEEALPRRGRGNGNGG